jgi:hypothetical protein
MPHVTPPPAPVTGEPAQESAPAPVLVATILLYVGGGVTLLYALAGLTHPGSVGGLVQSGVSALFGLVYVGLGWAIGKRWAWARWTLFVLCGVSAALVVVRIVAGGYVSSVASLAWPIVYVVLLTRRSARAWFAGSGRAEA